MADQQQPTPEQILDRLVTTFGKAMMTGDQDLVQFSRARLSQFLEQFMIVPRPPAEEEKGEETAPKVQTEAAAPKENGKQKAKVPAKTR